MNTGEWQEAVAGNLILKRDGFTISYNPDCSNSIVGFVDALLGLDQGAETALVIGDKYLILDGDHRAEYERLGDLKSCVEYFESHQEVMSPTSDTVGDLLVGGL